MPQMWIYQPPFFNSNQETWQNQHPSVAIRCTEQQLPKSFSLYSNHQKKLQKKASRFHDYSLKRELLEVYLGNIITLPHFLFPPCSKYLNLEPFLNTKKPDPLCQLCINDYFGLKFPFKAARMKAAGSSQRHHQEQRAYRALCCGCTCNCRLSFSSSDETESFSSERFPSVSSIAHAMVQERLDQMIREKRGKERRKQRIEETKFVVIVAMEKCSDDPKEDFRVSMREMILANRIEEPKDLRNLLNYYISMNSDECHGVILEVFHEVCCNLFLAYGRRI